MSQDGRQPATPSDDQTYLSRRRQQSPKTIYIAGTVLLFCIFAALAIPFLRAQKLHLAILRNQIETAAAPDEPVLIDDWLLRQALLWKSSPALQHQLIYCKDNKLPTDLLATNQELLLAVAEGDPLLIDLQAHGFRLAPNASQAAWVAAGKGFHTPGHPGFRIYFAASAKLTASPKTAP